MQLKKAQELKKRWGNKPCDHSSLEKEYYLGTATGDYICTDCGESGPGSDWPNKQSKPNTKKD